MMLKNKQIRVSRTCIVSSLLVTLAWPVLSHALDSTVEPAAAEQQGDGFLPLIPPVAEDGYIHLEWDSLMPSSFGAAEVPEASTDSQLVEQLIGKKITIPGFVVPLDFDGQKVHKFLFVPYMGACIHVPPPPPNQLIYVEMEEGLILEEQWTPVELFGTLGAEYVETEIGAAGYSMVVDEVREFVY